MLWHREKKKFAGTTKVDSRQLLNGCLFILGFLVVCPSWSISSSRERWTSLRPLPSRTLRSNRRFSRKIILM
jgi:hypothetical protein